MDNVVTKNAKPAEPMVSGGAPYEDLGGPTPTNSKPDDDSNKLKIPELASVKDVVNSKAKPAEPMPVMAGKELEGEEISEDEAPATDEVVAEEETTTDEVVAEEETTEEEVVAEEEDYKVDVEQDVQALFEGEELSEEFQTKARTIFEAAIKEKVSEIKENLQTAYEQALVEEVDGVRNELTERVESSTGAPSERTIKIFLSSFLFLILLYAQVIASPSIFSLSRPSLSISPKLFFACLQ